MATISAREVLKEKGAGTRYGEEASVCVFGGGGGGGAGEKLELSRDWNGREVGMKGTKHCRTPVSSVKILIHSNSGL